MWVLSQGVRKITMLENLLTVTQQSCFSRLEAFYQKQKMCGSAFQIDKVNLVVLSEKNLLDQFGCNGPIYAIWYLSYMVTWAIFSRWKWAINVTIIIRDDYHVRNLIYIRKFGSFGDVITFLLKLAKNLKEFQSSYWKTGNSSSFIRWWWLFFQMKALQLLYHILASNIDLVAILISITLLFLPK